MSAPDIALTADYIRHVDSGIEAAADEVDRVTHRRFWNAIETNKWDWPNFQRAYPWRIWFDQKELADVTVIQPTVTTGGNDPQTIPDSAIFWGPWNYAPPYRWLELDRSQSYSFGLGDTPQQDVHIMGLYGFWTRTRPGGELTAAVTNTTGTSVTGSDSSLVGVGDVIIIDSESMLVRDKTSVSTGIAFGSLDADSSDNALAVPDATQFDIGEIITLDSEQCQITSIVVNNLILERAVGGTILAAHTSGNIYAARGLTVQRGFGNSTAATHSDNASISASLIPPEVREYAIAEALNYVYQKTSGYARTIGEGGAATVPGGSLPDLRDRVWQLYGRKARTRAI